MHLIGSFETIGAKVDDDRSLWLLCIRLQASYSGGLNRQRRSDPERTLKAPRGPDCGLELAHMKSEFRVIGHDHGPVNQDPGIVLIAHHGPRGYFIGSGRLAVASVRYPIGLKL